MKQDLEHQLQDAEKELADLLDRAPTGVRRGHWSVDISLAEHRVERIKAQISEQKAQGR